MIDLNNEYFHFIGGYQNIDINKNIIKLNSILSSGYILSREKQLSLLNSNFSNKGSNWNGSNYVSICKIGKCNDNYEDKAVAYDLFCYTGSIAIILDNSIIYNCRKNYRHMQGEVQIKDIIDSKYFLGVGIQFTSYYNFLLNKISDKEKLKLLKEDIKLYQMVLEITDRYNSTLFALNDGTTAYSYLDKGKKLLIK